MDHAEYLKRRSAVVSVGFEVSNVPMIVVDEARNIVLASDGAGVLCGMSRMDMIGQPLKSLFLSSESLDECIVQPTDTNSCLCDLEVRHSQGEIVPVEVHCQPFVSQSVLDQTSSPNDDPNATPADGSTIVPESPYRLVMLTDTRRRAHEDELRAARLAKLSLLNQVSEALYGAHLTLDQILQAVLICMTAGQGLRFNRAFLLLVDEKREVLQGEIAIGPSNADEASRIWRDLAGQPGDLFEMMTSYDQSIKQTDVAVNEIVRHMSVPISDHDNILIRTMHDRQALSVDANMQAPGMETMRFWLGCDEFAIAPLTTRRGPLGVIVSDNAISGTPITTLDLEFLQMFANQSAGAIENSRLYHELEKRLLDLRKAHQQQKADQETLLRMERLSVMGETSAIVAHELRNPLVAIGGFARTLVRSLDENDPNREFARIITDEVGRLERIIHDLLDFIRPRKQMRKLIVIDQLVAETAGRMQAEMDSQGIGLRYDLKAGETELKCHPGEIQQILQNFILNAMQVLEHGGAVEVATSVLEGGVKIEVRDNGPGFSKDVADKLFSPFFSTKPTGSGLGLTICAQIIKSHGGVPGAENRDEGGAVFSFILPLPKDLESE